MRIACLSHPATGHHTIARRHIRGKVQIGSSEVLETIEYVTLGDARLWTARQGSGPPLVLLHGDADPRPAWAARQVAALLPKAQFQRIPQAGHFPWLEQPAGFAAIVRAFL